LDGLTGEVWQRKLTSNPADVLGWVVGLPWPVQVVYEAGPAGIALARFFRGHGVQQRLDPLSLGVTQQCSP
jgi:hypothetical protein